MLSPMGSSKLFLVGLLFWALVECQPNATLQVVGQNYTQFDLFKNTGFQACPSNKIMPPNVLATRGGSVTRRGEVSSQIFIMDQTVNTENAFCSHLDGTPVVIPTMPSQTAFFPW